MKPGARFVTLKQFPDSESSYFEVESQAWYKMSWGRTTVYTLKRRPATLGDRSNWLQGGASLHDAAA